MTSEESEGNYESEDDYEIEPDDREEFPSDAEIDYVGAITFPEFVNDDGKVIVPTDQASHEGDMDEKHLEGDKDEDSLFHLVRWRTPGAFRDHYVDQRVNRKHRVWG